MSAVNELIKCSAETYSGTGCPEAVSLFDMTTGRMEEEFVNAGKKEGDRGFKRKSAQLKISND